MNLIMRTRVPEADVTSLGIAWSVLVAAVLTITGWLVADEPRGDLGARMPDSEQRTIAEGRR